MDFIMKASVVLCTYNGEKYLPEQLESIFCQTRLPDELVIYDDRSTDDTWEIVNALCRKAPCPTILKRNFRTLGVTENFESALKSSSGDVIFLCDQDDVWMPEKIEIVANIFDGDNATRMVFTNGQVVDANLQSLHQTLWQAANMTGIEMKAFEHDAFDFLLTKRNLVNGAAAAFSRQVIQEALPFPRDMAVLHDAWLALVASANSNVKTVESPLLLYRQHTGQVCGAKRHLLVVDRPHYESHLAQLIELSNRVHQMPHLVNKSNLATINSYIEHLRVRLNLPTSIFGRISLIDREITSGRYGRFSSGFRSALKDLVKGSSGLIEPNKDRTAAETVGNILRG
jgi:hypothetical protein